MQAIQPNITGAFSSPKHRAASRTVGDVVYAVLTANANMGDGVALFHTATHKNLAGTNAAVSVTSMGVAEVAMGLQKDIGGKRRLNIKLNEILNMYRQRINTLIQNPNLPAYADNAAAIAAGLVVGDLYYRTGHGLDIVR